MKVLLTIAIAVILVTAIISTTVSSQSVSKAIRIITNMIQDADKDTLVQTEESPDEDMIRFDTAGTERMIINAIGQIGIGTPSPSAILEIAGDLEVASLEDNDGSNFFDGGCSDNQHVTAISSNGAISCGADSGDISTIQESGTTPLTFSGCSSGICSLGMETDGSGLCTSGAACTGGHTHHSLDADDGSPTGAVYVDYYGRVNLNEPAFLYDLTCIGSNCDYGFGAALEIEDTHMSGKLNIKNSNGNTILSVYGGSDYGEIGMEKGNLQIGNPAAGDRYGIELFDTVDGSRHCVRVTNNVLAITGGACPM